MSYHSNINAEAPHPIYPQQTGYSTNQSTFNNAGVQQTAAYLPSNQQSVQHAPLPQQQSSPYVYPAASGAQFVPKQQHPQQQYGASPQPMTTTQPQVYSSHPQVVVVGCPQGHHNYITEFGTCGIIAAILLFPIGLIFLFIDQERKCNRCGARA